MNRVIAIIAVIFALGIGLFWILYERTEVTDFMWNKSYHPMSEDPYSTSGFFSILKDHYEDSKMVARYKDTIISEIESSGNVLIHFSSTVGRYYFEDSESSIYEWIEQGNTALIASQGIYINSLIDDIYISTTTAPEDSIITIEYCNSLPLTDLQKRYKVSPYDQLANDYYGDNLIFNNPEALDSIDAESLIHLNEDCIIFLRIPIGEGTLLLHALPDLYTNYALHQEVFTPHLNYTLELLPEDPEMIIIDHDIYQKFSTSYSTSPIRFILDHASLRWAYFVLLGTILLYFLFKGKRRLRPIPVIRKPVNSSIDYAETLATLYAGQDKNEDLIPHFNEIFYHHVKEKYFILKNDPDFTEKLSRKAEFPKNKIQAILSHFSAIENKSTINNHQLGLIYGRLEDFYKHTT